MFLRKIDFLSPEITLYNKGLLYHSSLISSILTIILFLIVISFSIQYLSILWQREKEDPKISFYYRFLEYVGEYTINTSSFFHFININSYKDNLFYEEIDFTSFRIIGLDIIYDEYKLKGNLSNFNHWLYGPCNNEIDTKGISHLIKQEYFNKSACIKKYFNPDKGKYYNINEDGFKWPILANEFSNFNKTIYNVFVEKCEQETLDEITDKKLKCKDISESEEYFKYSKIQFHFIDEFVDIKRYEKPVIKYLYTIEDKLDKETFIVNHLSFNPAFIRTNDDIIRNNFKEEISYSFNNNEVNVYQYYKNVYIIYYFWINNRVNYYERTYQKLQDIISRIGGTYEVIVTIFIIFNKIFNYYAILTDTEELLSQCPCYVKELMKKRRINIQSLKTNTKQTNIELEKLKKERQIREKEKNNDFNSSSREQVIDKDKLSSTNKKINNSTFILNKSNDNEINKKISNEENIENKDNENNTKNNYNLKDKITFCQYLKYKITFGKINNHLQIYENFRINIISVENIITNYLRINYLFKVLNLKKE